MTRALMLIDVQRRKEPASAISAQIDRELAAEGSTVLPFGEVSFGERA